MLARPLAKWEIYTLMCKLFGNTHFWDQTIKTDAFEGVKGGKTRLWRCLWLACPPPPPCACMSTQGA